MAINYSNLFSNSIGNSNNNFLADWASIKNGSYRRLLNAHYDTVDSYGSNKDSEKKSVLDQILEEKKNPVVSTEAQEANSALTSAIPTLKSTVATLQDEDTYKVTDDGKSAEDKVTSALKDFVSQYNDVVNAAKKSTLPRQTSHVASIMGKTKENAEKLSAFGITLNQDGTLKLDEKKLEGVDVTKVQDLFSGNDLMSYGSFVASRLNFASATGTIPSNSVTGAEEEEEAEEEEAARTGAAALKSNIDDLLGLSIFQKVKGEDGTYQYDVGKIFDTMKSFVSNYNDMIDASRTSGNSGVQANLNQIRTKTAQNITALGKYGITVDTQGKLKIDEEKFKAADMGDFQSFFKGYGNSIKGYVSLVDYYMTTQASPVNGYTGDGSYDVQGGFRYDSFI